MERSALALVAILLIALTPATLRGETTTACDTVNPVAEASQAKFIQPGAHVMKAKPSLGAACVPEEASDCTLGFLLRDPATGRVWATAAGHCFGAMTVGQQSNPRYAYDPALGPFARLSYSATVGSSGWDPTVDIALLRIFDDYQNNVDASVMVWGGPQGMIQPGDEATENGTTAHVGVPLGAPAPIPRIGILRAYDAQLFHCTCAVAHGDSGSPMVDLSSGGKAMGLLYGAVNDNDPTGNPTVSHWTGTHAMGPLFKTQLDIIRAASPEYANLVLYEAPLSAFAEAFVEEP